MKVTFTLDIENCRQCPFCHYVSEFGFCGFCCDHPKADCYDLVPDEGFREDCPAEIKEYVPKH
jgi:hypothetical protein